MNTKVWYLPYFEGVYHTRMIETYLNVNARMVRMVHCMYRSWESIVIVSEILTLQQRDLVYSESQHYSIYSEILWASRVLLREIEVLKVYKSLFLRNH